MNPSVQQMAITPEFQDLLRSHDKKRMQRQSKQSIQKKKRVLEGHDSQCPDTKNIIQQNQSLYKKYNIGKELLDDLSWQKKDRKIRLHHNRSLVKKNQKIPFDSE